MLSKKQILRIYFQDHPAHSSINLQNLQQQLNSYFISQQIQILYQQEHFLHSSDILLYLQSIIQNSQEQINISQLMNKLIDHQPEIKIQYKKLEDMLQSIIQLNFNELQKKIIKNTLHNSQKAKQQKILNGNTQMKKNQKIEEKIKTKNSSENNQNIISTEDKQDAIKLRLKILFQLYTKKQFNQNKSNTFQQIQQKVKSMNLNIWMRFNRDFKILEIIQKQQVYKIFKTYSINRIINFDQFYQAIKYIFQKKSAVEVSSPWKYLSVSSQQQFNNKLKELGVPMIQNENIKKCEYILPNLKKMGKKSQPYLHKINMTFEIIDLQKLSNLKLKNRIHIDKEEEDNIYLKQYNIQQKDPKKNFIINNKKKLHKQTSQGILHRMDQRIRKYLRH